MTLNPTDDSPLASVVMAVYEPDPVFFPKAVKSILNQTCTELELIVMEDPSPSQASSLLAPLADDRVRHYVNERRTSLVVQKNQAIALARAPVIAVMDADDVAHPSRLQSQLDFLAEHPNVDVLGSQIAVIDAADCVVGHRRFPLSHDEILEAIPRYVPLSHPSVMLRREVVERLGGYQFVEYAAAEDYELWSRWIQRGVRFANHPEELISYRLHPNQNKFVKLRETIRGDLRIKQMYWYKQMGVRARMRYVAQRSLLCLPDRLIAMLLTSLLYRGRPGGAGKRENRS